MKHEQYFEEQLKHSLREENPFIYYLDMIKDSEIRLNLKKVKLSELRDISLGKFIEYNGKFPVFERMK